MDSSRRSAYVGIGTNLGDRIGNIERALAAIGEVGRIVAQSSIYRTKPWGNPKQPWFANAVILLETKLSPHALLAALKRIEQNMGRVATKRWGPRVIDLDLLLYDELEIDDPDLRVPHAHLRERAFVLVPLAEIDGRFRDSAQALPASERAGVELYKSPRSVGS
jgi:2-amino-4-hydroxy-6-hydroxymethyldihydropteridine diphosphokinase